MRDYFNSSLDHLMAEFERIQNIIALHIQQFAKFSEANNDYQGLQITKQEILSLLSRPIGSCYWLQDSLADSIRKRSQIARRQIDTKATNSLKKGILLRVIKLASLFKLNAIETEMLLFLLIAELDNRFGTFYAYLQNDINKKYLTVDLLLNFIASEVHQKVEFMYLFEPNNHLTIYKLISIGNQNTGLINQEIRLDPRISSYLLGFDNIQQNLISFVNLIKPKKIINDLVLPSQLEEKINTLLSTVELATPSLAIQIYGKKGSGKKTLSEAICKKYNLNLLVVDIFRIIESKADDKITLIIREAVLQNAAIYLQNAHLLLKDSNNVWLIKFIHLLDNFPGLIFIAIDGGNYWRKMIKNRSLITLDMTALNMRERAEVWRRVLPQASTETISDVAGQFKLTAGEIIDAANKLQMHVYSNVPLEDIDSTELYKICRSQATHKLGNLAKRLTPIYHRQDIVLPSYCQQKLDQIISYVKNYHYVYEDWGFKHKFADNKGLNILFSGPPGTGKTMAAEVIAGSLQLDIYKIDLSLIVSKFIGETEKNLSQIFEEGESSDAILFFDEADALFGKRSEVQDAHDRYANMETSYLLQKMEEYAGIVILATNFKRNLDDAFVRRLHFSIDFPMPTENERLTIWRNIWPSNLPLCSDIDLTKIAKKLEISGGNIRNIALLSAFKAAEDRENNKSLTLKHIIWAAQQEFMKMGKIIQEQDFIDLTSN